MTPTEQDKELREKIADVFDELCEPTNEFWHRDSGLHLYTSEAETVRKAKRTSRL